MKKTALLRIVTLLLALILCTAQTFAASNPVSETRNGTVRVMSFFDNDYFEGSGLGTAFIVSEDDGDTYLVTNRHVISEEGILCNQAYILLDDYAMTHMGFDSSHAVPCELYYVDPSDRDKYIALDDYFGYLKEARVNELQKIAQELGAKHFRVTYKEQKTTFSGNTVKGKASAKYAGESGTMDAERDLAATAVATVEIAAEMDCPGHAPNEPKLYYLQREPSIQNLIALRMDKDSPLTHQKYTLKLSNSSGIKEKDALKIDAALKSMKIAGNTTVTSEVRNESRRFFEYEIDF